MCNSIPLKPLVPLRSMGGLMYSLVVLAAAFFGTPVLAAQTPATAPAAAPAHKTTSTHTSAHPHKRPTTAHVQTAAYKAAPAPVTPHAPATPLWPANETPAQASVTWDSRGLRIEAANSSLMQILKDVSTVTGAKVEGLNADQRIFGAYGPGLARDVLSQLLQGSGYNVLMIGDQGQGAPRQIVLSSRRTGEVTQAANNNPAASAADDDVDTDEQPQAPPLRPGFAPGAPPRSPQQIMQEMQQRQQQMQQHPTSPQ